MRKKRLLLTVALAIMALSFVSYEALCDVSVIKEAFQVPPSSGAEDVEASICRPRWPGKNPAAAELSEQIPIDTYENVGSGPVIYGSVMYTVTEDPDELGMYTIDGLTGRISPVSLTDHIVANGGGIYDNGIYRFVSSTSETGQILYYEYNVEDWSMIKCEELSDWSNFGFDEAYDPTTGNVYGCFMDEIGARAYFGYIDHDTHKVTQIRELVNMIYFGIVVTPEGDVYAVASDGNLYKINKYDGSATVVGKLGVMPKYNQSAVCDQKTGIVYWLACDTSGTSGLYTIDLSSGKASLVRTFSKREGVVGAFIAQTPYAENGPGKVSGLSLDFLNAATSGGVSFSLPTHSVSGVALTDDVEWLVTANNILCGRGWGTPGERVEVPVSFDAEGEYSFSVSVSDDNGRGELARVKKYIGYDAPSPVKNLSLSLTDGNTVNISWDAPVDGMHSGYLDKSDISYRILRYPGSTMVSSSYKKNSFTQKLSATKYSACRYEVVSQSHGVRGDGAFTKYIAVGPAQPLPCVLSTQNESSASLYVCDVSDGTGNSAWSYDGGVKGFVNSGNSDSDALITPYVYLDGSHICKVTVSAMSTGGNSLLDVGCGLSPNGVDIATWAYSSMNVKGDQLSDYVFNIAPPTGGQWHVGLTADVEDGATLNVFSIKIEDGPAFSAPGPVKDLAVVPVDNDANSVAVSFIAPSTTIDGGKLETIDKVSLLRDGKVVGEISHPAPGSTIKIIDADTPNGFVTYEAKAFNESGEGLPVCVEAYVGQDIPTAPLDVTLTDDITSVRLTWTAPKTGVNGAYINADELTYTILRNDNVVVARDVSGTMYEDNADFGEDQRFLQYAVYASSTAGMGTYGMSNAVVVGKPYDLPFQEGFPNGALNYSFWEANGSGDVSMIIDKTSGLGDVPGCIVILPKKDKDEGSLISGKISLTGSSRPTLRYSFMGDGGTDSRLEVSVLLPDGRESPVDAVEFNALNLGKIWHTRTVDLTEFSDVAYVRIRLHLIAGTQLAGVSLDDIRIDGGYDFDLAVYMNTIASVDCGDIADALITVCNLGHKGISDAEYEVYLYKDGEIVDEIKGEAVDAFGSVDYRLSLAADIFDGDVIKVYAEVKCPLDEMPENDMTPDADIKVKHQLFPRPEALDGLLDDTGISLIWQGPDPSLFDVVLVNDDVETYEPFAIDDVGNWTLSDIDGSRTFGISDGAGGYINYPNAIEPKAFIVFNTSEASLPQPSRWMPHSGNQMFVSFQASGTASDDWLISPELSGNAQTISFYARTFNTERYGADTYEILYSTTDSNPDNFRIAASNTEASDEWSLVEAALPDGAKYFAIRCTSVGRFAFMVDDITYSPDDFSELRLLGYNVYRDKQRLNSEPVCELSFETKVDIAEADYQVSAVYDRGESKPCNPIRLGVSSVSSVGSDSVCVKIINGGISIDGAKGRDISVYSVDGIVAYRNEKADETEVVLLARGIYIVTIGSETFKVTVNNL